MTALVLVELRRRIPLLVLPVVLPVFYHFALQGSDEVAIILAVLLPLLVALFLAAEQRRDRLWLAALPLTRLGWFLRPWLWLFGFVVVSLGVTGMMAGRLDWGSAGGALVSLALLSPLIPLTQRFGWPGLTLGLLAVSLLALGGLWLVDQALKLPKPAVVSLAWLAPVLAGLAGTGSLAASLKMSEKGEV